MSPNATKEVKAILWMFVFSFFLTPAVLWFVGKGVRDDY